jgi:hypothetical protein
MSTPDMGMSAAREEADTPIVFAYDSNGIRIATYRGTVDDACLLEAYGELIVRPDFIRRAHDLVDLREVGRLEVSSEGLRRLGWLVSGGEKRQRPAEVAGLAIVASTPLSFGLARMFEALTEGYLPKDTQVFHEFDEAMSWLLSRPRLDWTPPTNKWM